MITIKLTKKEAEHIFEAITYIKVDAACWDEDMKDLQGGKKFFDSLRSVQKKIYKSAKLFRLDRE